MKLRISQKAARWILNIWILMAFAMTITTIVLSFLCVSMVQEMSRELAEFRGVIEGVGYQ